MSATVTAKLEYSTVTMRSSITCNIANDNIMVYGIRQLPILVVIGTTTLILLFVVVLSVAGVSASSSESLSKTITTTQRATTMLRGRTSNTLPSSSRSCSSS